MTTLPHLDRGEIFAFGEFEFAVARLELRRNGSMVRLQQQPLKILAALLRRPGEVVTRDELRMEIWGQGVHLEFDDALNHAIKYLRDALGDRAGNPQFIETIPRRGYRFIAPVEKRPVAGGETAQGTASSPAKELAPWTAASVAQRWRWQLAAGSLLLVVVAYVLWASATPRVAPHVINAVQLTHFGFADTVVTDGRRLYVSQAKGGIHSIVTFPADGNGPPVPFPTPFWDVRILDISPHRTRLLVAAMRRPQSVQRLWVLPVSGGVPRNIGNIESGSAKWSPGAKRVAFAGGSDSGDSGLYIANADGTGAHLITRDAAFVESWSPDGKAVRFTRMNLSGGLAMWEVGEDGSHEHPVLPLSRTRNARWGEGVCCGRWTADGRYFLYEEATPRNTGLWAVPEPSLLGGIHAPVEIYSAAFHGAGTGASIATGPGKQVLMIGWSEEREFARFDSARKQFIPLLPGVDAATISISPDGQWIAYTALPDLSLWKVRVATGERVQLSSPPAQIFGPVWSPDGSQIAVHVLYPGKRGKVEIIPAAGGAPRVLFSDESTQEDAQNWMPDGKSILLGRLWFDAKGNEVKAKQCILNLASGAVSEVPGSEDKTSPVISPDGHFLVTQSSDFRQLLLFDFKSGQWSTLASGTLIWQPHWSHDSRFVYYQDVRKNAQQPIYRTDINTRAAELVATRDQTLRPDISAFGLVGLTTDDQPIVTFIRRNSDVYALDVDLP